MTKKYIKDLGENEVIHAPTLSIAEAICEKFDELGLNWGSGGKYTENNWIEYKSETCYSPKEGSFGDKSSLIDDGYTVYNIIDLHDFIKIKFNDSPQPHYDNSVKSFRSLMELGLKLELNHYEQDILKRLVRCRKKGQFKQDLQKIKDTIDIYINEYDERNRN
ncbi:hypothetical protein [Elizabethkingia meningoseptica]|uniref:hypothetical protein n=1 Tax=Elizabethkingia meningoseptica TaxID=238 RepID=UPI001626EF83|nr:hypothetical protein [Elizabethkingia meningoseptica]HAY3553726.1 hypothetical protein [Elizabethkingia meningoseptica]